jgi:hypothetical protein
VLLTAGTPVTRSSQQLALDLGEVEEQVERAWEGAMRRAKEARRTRFAQRRLRPDDVLPEWTKATAVLGGAEDVARFVRASAERLNTPLETYRGHHRLPVAHLPGPLRERLGANGIDGSYKLSFAMPAPPGFEFVHRSHPLVAVLADHIAETALAEENPDIAARSGAIFTDEVEARVALILLRLRHDLLAERLVSGRVADRRNLLAEECLAVRTDANGGLTLLSEQESVRLLSLTPSRNMAPQQRAQQVQRELEHIAAWEPEFWRIAEARAAELLADHQRVREAAHGKGEAVGMRYSVTPVLPADVIGVYVLIPTPKL